MANKHADVAWISAPNAEKTARFASAEAVRWDEWGMRRYQNFALGCSRPRSRGRLRFRGRSPT